MSGPSSRPPAAPAPSAAGAAPAQADVALASVAQAVPQGTMPGAAGPVAKAGPAVRNVRGIGFMLLAVGCFALMDALLKALAAHYPPLQVAALRGLSALPLVALYVLWRGQARQLLRVHWPLHLLRGVLSVGLLGLFAYGLQTLGLAEAYTVFFIGPLLITLLSGPMLGERVQPAHWVAVAVGLVGVVVALRPDEGALLSLGALAVLGSAVCYALIALTARLLTRREHSAVLVFWTMALLALGASLLAAPHWRALDAAHAWLIGALALTGFLGQLAVTEAFRHGQASVVAPFEYTALAWGVGLDWALWNLLPGAHTLVGGTIVIACGLWLVRRERQHR